MNPLNLFYAATDLDRWSRRDRFPWRFHRRVAPRSYRASGQTRVFLNLVAGLKELDIPHRINDFAYASRHPKDLCCVIGKRRMLESRSWINPLLIGPCVYDHPIDSPRLFEKYNVRRVLVPGEWMRRMCEPHWGSFVHAWPGGIDTDYWAPSGPNGKRDIDVLVYDKVLWDRKVAVPRILGPVLAEIDRRKLRSAIIRYGRYEPDQYRTLLQRTRSMAFLSEHETQGLAYQEALSAGVPVLAWDSASHWKDPNYYPHKVVFSPVSGAPYWDDRCGVRFRTPDDFGQALDQLVERQAAGDLDPRSFVLENLSLKKSAAAFAEHAFTAGSEPVA